MIYEVTLETTKQVLIEADSAAVAERCGKMRWRQEIMLSLAAPDCGDATVTATEFTLPPHGTKRTILRKK